MSTVKINIQGAEKLGDLFDMTLAEVQSARSAGIPVEVSQDRGVIESAIVFTIASAVEPYVKEFVMKFIGKIAQNLADKIGSAKKVEAFTVTVNNAHYKLPDDLERLRKEQSLA